MTLFEILALLALGGIAGFINVLSAGGSMLTLPLLMFLGLPPQVANGTNRVAITLQSITAVGSFYRMGHGNLMVSLHLAVPAILGSLLGAWVATWVSDAVFEVVLVSAMVERTTRERMSVGRVVGLSVCRPDRGPHSSAWGTGKPCHMGGGANP